MQRYFAKNEKLELQDTDIHHIKNVMRMSINDKIEVIYNKKIYLCLIESINPFQIKIVDNYQEERNLDIELTIAISLVTEQKFDLILQKLTELGVHKIIPLRTERSIVKITNDKVDKKIKRWNSICKEASEQSKRTNIPIITDIMSIDDLTKLNYDIKLVASTKEKDKLLNYYLQNIGACAKIIMVIGPEGGISDKEESLLCSRGYNRVSFGKLIFRVETAAIYVASIFNFSSSKR